MTESASERRLKHALNAIAITEMEGGEASEHVKMLLQAWIDGHITSQEMREAVYERARGPAPKKESE